MGFSYRRRIRLGANSWVNVSRSGISVSRRTGPVTVNSRDGLFVRLGRGLSWRKKL